MAKYTLVAYFLWLTLGWFGVHHFYLGRDKQGILWLTSFAGFFGVGWIRDFYRISVYVKDANEEQSYMSLLGSEIRYYGRPSIFQNLHRIVGMFLFGWLYRALIYSCIPEEYSHPVLVAVLIPIGTTFGTFMVSNVGRMQSRFAYSLCGALLGELLFGHMHLLSEESTSSYAVVISVLFSVYDWNYDRTPSAEKRKEVCKRFLVCTFAFAIFCSLIGTGMYFNASVVTKDGERVKVRESLNNFFRSPHWKQMKRSGWDIWEDYRNNGWESAYKRMIILADVEGESRARLVLDVQNNSTFREVKERYRELAKQWHPDHHQGEEKITAQERFIEIKEAYETLSVIYSRRKGY